jgi:hypothetical protein
MIFIGDVHAEFAAYAELIRWIGDYPSIQLGDMGIGFAPSAQLVIPSHHRFIRGNHDDPQMCSKMPNYLGDFGYLPEHKIFFVSGAWSPDMYVRTEDVNWWPDEELDKASRRCALAQYKKVKPRIVVSHDCPLSVLHKMYDRRQVELSATAQLLDDMFEYHKPEAWVFAHHHRSMCFAVAGTSFYCLRILEALRLTEHAV